MGQAPPTALLAADCASHGPQLLSPQSPASLGPQPGRRPTLLPKPCSPSPNTGSHLFHSELLPPVSTAFSGYSVLSPQKFSSREVLPRVHSLAPVPSELTCGLAPLLPAAPPQLRPPVPPTPQGQGLPPPPRMCLCREHRAAHIFWPSCPHHCFVAPVSHPLTWLGGCPPGYSLGAGCPPSLYFLCRLRRPSPHCWLRGRRRLSGASVARCPRTPMPTAPHTLRRDP